ncbi:hypothetical protein DPEC_G00246080 [Dallia pectoralis]|uniref:Uncharacterized protein n=1 Tax=Dallia pectoralis TaxID=75939 RepID=A0ACC2FWB1_DALPE|nr:hypothetical protein DPEC_G00246080 [Dallia pectoralis]
MFSSSGDPEVNVRSELDTRGTEGRDKGTESGSGRVNVAACLAVPVEWVLHQLQLGPKGLMDKTAQQGSRVRRPLSTRANWPQRREFRHTGWPSVAEYIHMYTAALIDESSIKALDLSERMSFSVVLLFSDRPGLEQSQPLSPHRPNYHLQGCCFTPLYTI